MKRIVYLAPVVLNSPAQRPHHFVEWAHQTLGSDVWWVEPYPVRLPRWNDWRRLRPPPSNDLGPHWMHSHWLKTVHMPSLPIEPLPGGWALNRWLQRKQVAEMVRALDDDDTWLVIGRPSGMALTLCRQRQGLRVLYDVMDEMSGFVSGISRAWMVRTHQQVARQAQYVWASSSALRERLQGVTRHPPILVRNGTSVAPLPPTHTARSPWVLGYVGTLASWFDWSWIKRLALALPDAQIRLYGPQATAIPDPLPPNVTVYPPVPHAEVFGLLGQWHAGLIPFKRNALTAAVDPVKYYEYRAAGLPVLSTCFGEMQWHASDEGVWLLETLDLGPLPAQLAAWHARPIASRVANAPDFGWQARFSQGAKQLGWLNNSKENASTSHHES